MPKFDASMIDTEAVRVRTLEHAVEAGEGVREGCMRSYDKHIKSGILAVGIAEAMAWAEFHEATEKFIQDKNLGKHNDQRTTVARGVTAIVTGFVKSAMEHQLGIDDGGLFDPVFEPIDGVELEGSSKWFRELYTVSLPSGVFDAGSDKGDVDFFRAGEVDHGMIVRPEGRLLAYSVGVLRIVGGGGELWQNPDYNVDGTRATQPVVDLDISSIRS